LRDSGFYAWSPKQAALLRAGPAGEAEAEAIAEEIGSLGKIESANS